MNQKSILSPLILCTLSLGLCTLLLFASCANTIAPEGGPRDETPPALVPEDSSPSLQTNFTKQPIELTFDEWVVLEDVFNQVVISPPLEFRPELRLKRRTVIFEFDEREELRPAATYTINFGAAVKDLNEKNPAEDLRFVFSTGDFIDSLSMTGRIVDAVTGKPVEGILFMLYENLADTVVRTERPFYFSKSGKDGTFRIDNIKTGVFKGFALEDKDLNYRFSQVNERIGFPDSLITIADTLTPEVTIRLFEETRELRLNDALSDRYGLTRLAFNRPPYDISLDYTDRGQSVYLEYEKDTVRVWYDQPDEGGWNVFVTLDTTLNDTVLIDPRGRSEFFEKAQLKLAGRAGGTQTLNPTRPARMTFNHPLRSIDTTFIRLYEDTLRTVVRPELQIDTANRRTLSIAYNWKEDLPYQLEILPGGLTDWYGLQNDTLLQDYKAGQRKSFGNLNLTVENLQPDTSYVLQLKLKSDIVDEFRARGVTTFRQELRHLPPGNYSLTVITDLNDNGRWDPGHYDTQRQPEPIETHEMEQLRANWDLDARVILGTQPAEEKEVEKQ